MQEDSSHQRDECWWQQHMVYARDCSHRVSRSFRTSKNQLFTGAFPGIVLAGNEDFCSYSLTSAIQKTPCLVYVSHSQLRIYILADAISYSFIMTNIFITSVAWHEVDICPSFSQNLQQKLLLFLPVLNYSALPSIFVTESISDQGNFFSHCKIY